MNDASLRRVFGNAGWFLGSKGVTGLLSLFYLALATRSLGLAGFGQFAMVTALAQAVAGLVTFQTWQIVIRFGMPHLHAQDARRLDAVISFAALLDGASAIVGTIVAGIALALLAPTFGWSSALAWQASLFCAVVLLSLRSTPLGVLRLHDKFAAAALADSLTPIARLGGAVAAALLDAGVTGFLIAWACAEIASALCYWALALRCHRVGRVRHPIQSAVADNPGLWRFAWLTNASSTVSQSTRQITLLMVGSIGGPAAAGAFRIAAQLAQAMTKLTLALSRSVFPELVRASASERSGDFERLIIRTSAVALATGTVAILALALAGQSLLGFLAGQAIPMAYWPMMLLTTAAALDLAGSSLEPALSARGHNGLALLLRLAATLVQVVLLVGLLPSFGALGAGWASLAGSAAALVLLGIAARSRFGAHDGGRPARA